MYGVLTLKTQQFYKNVQFIYKFVVLTNLQEVVNDKTFCIKRVSVLIKVQKKFRDLEEQYIARK